MRGPLKDRGLGLLLLPLRRNCFAVRHKNNKWTYTGEEIHNHKVQRCTVSKYSLQSVALAWNKKIRKHSKPRKRQTLSFLEFKQVIAAVRWLLLERKDLMVSCPQDLKTFKWLDGEAPIIALIFFVKTKNFEGKKPKEYLVFEQSTDCNFSIRCPGEMWDACYLHGNNSWEQFVM